MFRRHMWTRCDPDSGLLYFLHTRPEGPIEDPADECQSTAGKTNHILVTTVAALNSSLQNEEPEGHQQYLKDAEVMAQQMC